MTPFENPQNKEEYEAADAKVKEAEGQETLTRMNMQDVRQKMAATDAARAERHALFMRDEKEAYEENEAFDKDPINQAKNFLQNKSKWPDIVSADAQQLEELVNRAQLTSDDAQKEFLRGSIRMLQKAIIDKGTAHHSKMLGVDKEGGGGIY